MGGRRAARPVGSDDRAIAQAAGEAGIEAPALSSYYHGPAAARGLLLGYAGVPGPAIAPAVARLALAIEHAPHGGNGHRLR